MSMKSMPIVEMKERRNPSPAKRANKHVLPTPAVENTCEQPFIHVTAMCECVCA